MTKGKINLAVGALLALLSCGTAQAQAQAYDAVLAEKSRQRHESTGLIGGMLIGGLVAGPPGAVFSAVAGALAGNHLSDTRSRKALLFSLERAEGELIALETEKRNLERTVALLRDGRLAPAAHLSTETAPACCAMSSLTLHFRSGSDTLEAHYQDSLREFARTARLAPDSVIQITGHADRRGTEDDNLQLSQRRILAVQRALQTLGVENATLQTVALGESRPLAAEESLEGNFFDRRVELRLRTPGNGLLTRAD